MLVLLVPGSIGPSYNHSCPSHFQTGLLPCTVMGLPLKIQDPEVAIGVDYSGIQLFALLEQDMLNLCSVNCNCSLVEFKVLTFYVLHGMGSG